VNAFVVGNVVVNVFVVGSARGFVVLQFNFHSRSGSFYSSPRNLSDVRPFSKLLKFLVVMFSPAPAATPDKPQAGTFGHGGGGASF
jgi:hypothetical protein